MQQCITIDALVPQENTPRQDHAGLEGQKKKKKIQHRDCDANRLALTSSFPVHIHITFFSYFTVFSKSYSFSLFFSSTAQPRLLLSLGGFSSQPCRAQKISCAFIIT